LAAPGGAASAQTLTLDFNDGTAGVTVGAFYSARGVTFSNTRWDSFVSPGEESVGAGGLKIVSVSGGFLPKQTTALIAVFDSPVSFVSIRGVNVGENGARIDAFDAALGGALLDSDEAFTAGAGTENHPLLSVSASGIRRIELYQPAATSPEGLLFDNLTYTIQSASASAPEPCGIAFVVLGGALPTTASLVRRCRRARRRNEP
jgi:hypothetical protein